MLSLGQYPGEKHSQLGGICHLLRSVLTDCPHGPQHWAPLSWPCYFFLLHTSFLLSLASLQTHSTSAFFFLSGHILLTTLCFTTFTYLVFNSFFRLPGQVPLCPIKPDLSPCSTLAMQPSLLLLSAEIIGGSSSLTQWSHSCLPITGMWHCRKLWGITWIFERTWFSPRKCEGLLFFICISLIVFLVSQALSALLPTRISAYPPLSFFTIIGARG